MQKITEAEQIILSNDFSDIIEKFNSIYDYKEIRPTLIEIYNDLEQTEIVKKFRSSDWNYYGYKFLKDENEMKIKCKVFEKNLDKNKYLPSSYPFTYKLYDKLNYQQYIKKKLPKEPKYYRAILWNNEFIELQNFSDVFRSAIYHEFLGRYKCKVITDEIDDIISKVKLSLYLRIGKFLCENDLKFPQKIKYFFSLIQNKCVDNTKKYIKLLNLINIALESCSGSLFVTKFEKINNIKPRINIGPPSQISIELETFDNNFLFESYRDLHVSNIVRWKYLCLKHIISNTIKDLKGERTKERLITNETKLNTANNNEIGKRYIKMLIVTTNVKHRFMVFLLLGLFDIIKNKEENKSGYNLTQIVCPLIGLDEYKKNVNNYVDQFEHLKKAEPTAYNAAKSIIEKYNLEGLTLADIEESLK